MNDFELVKIKKEDCDLVYRWANDLEVRKNSFSSEIISYDEHVEWFNKKMLSEDTEMYLFKNNTIPVGMLRLEKQSENLKLINYSIDKHYRKVGLGTELLKQTKNLFSDITLIGKVKKANISSTKAFENSDYKLVKEFDDYFVYSNKYE